MTTDSAGPVPPAPSHAERDPPDPLGIPLLAPFRVPRSAYIHVPFCRHRCGYCDFTLVAGRDDLIERYLAALRLQLQSLETPREVDTLFLGGGTPTHLPADHLDRLLGLVTKWLPLAPQGEFSVEGNPLDLVDTGRLRVLAARGVNRVSLGVQSFDDDVLRILERDHTAKEACRASELVQSTIPNVGLDLIFGVPGQEPQQWEATLQQACLLQPAHVSTYGLTFERGTSFWSRRAKGTLAAIPDALEADMYELAMDRLPEWGWEQYELSNFARPGRQCRHNGTYWAGYPCLAFGPGAARYLNGRREIGHRSTTTWLARVEAGQSPIGYREELPSEDRAREALVVGMRRTRGVERGEFLRDFGWDLEQLGGPAWDRLRDRGLIEEFAQGYRLTRQGRLLADIVTVELVGQF